MANSVEMTSSVARDRALVSIIVPAYKAGRHIAETLATIRSQQHTTWEVLVGEDGIVDNTAEIVRAFTQETTNPVRHFQNPTNQGVSRVRNTLLDAATGDYIAFLDADDLWPENYLADSLARMEAAGADWQVGGAQLIDEHGKRLERTIIPPVVAAASVPSELLKHSFILPSAVVARRKVFESGLRFNSEFKIGEDLDLWIRVIRAGFNPLLVPLPLISYRKHPASATADPVRFPEEFSRVFESYVGDTIVDQHLCRSSIDSMLTSVAQMTWRRDPARALRALNRLKRIGPWQFRAWRLFVMARLAQLTSFSRA